MPPIALKSFWDLMAGFEVTENASALTERMEALEKALSPKPNPLFNGFNGFEPLFQYNDTALVREFKRLRQCNHYALMTCLAGHDLKSDEFISLVKNQCYIDETLQYRTYDRVFVKLRNEIKEVKQQLAQWHNRILFQHAELIDTYRHHQKQWLQSHDVWSNHQALLKNLLNNTMQRFESYLTERYPEDPNKRQKVFNKYFRQIAVLEESQLTPFYQNYILTIDELTEIINRIINLSTPRFFSGHIFLYQTIVEQISIHQPLLNLKISGYKDSFQVENRENYETQYQQAQENYDHSAEALQSLNLSLTIKKGYLHWPRAVSQLEERFELLEQKLLAPINIRSIESQSENRWLLRDISHHVKTQISQLRNIDYQRHFYYTQLKQQFTNLSYWDGVSTSSGSFFAEYQNQYGVLPKRFKPILRLIKEQDSIIEKLYQEQSGLTLSYNIIKMKAVFLTDIQILLAPLLKQKPIFKFFQSHFKVTQAFLEQTLATLSQPSESEPSSPSFHL